MRPRRIACILPLVCLSPAGSALSANGCMLSGARYALASDTVNWSLTIGGGHSCIRGFRFNKAVVSKTILISPPQHGQVKLLGPGFSYTPNSDFQGKDFFTVEISGSINRVYGTSTIRISVDTDQAPVAFNSPENVPALTESSQTADGFISAPNCSVQNPSILNTYHPPGQPDSRSMTNAHQPPWHVAGVDYCVGYASNTVLKNPQTISIAGVSVNTADHIVYVTGNNVTLDGYDFSLNGGWQVYVNGDNTTIRNSYFKTGSNGLDPIYCYLDADNVTILNNVIDGNAANAGYGALITHAGGGNLTIQYNWLRNSYSDGIDAYIHDNGSGAVIDIRYNLIENTALGPSTVHGDIAVGDGHIASWTFAYNTYIKDKGAGTQGIGLGHNAVDSARIDSANSSNNTIIDKTGGMNWAFAVSDGDLYGPYTISNNYAYLGASTAFFSLNGRNSGSGNGTGTVTRFDNVNMKTGGAFPGNVTSVSAITDFSTDSGTLGDGLTNDNTLTLSGTAAANSTVKVLEGTTQVGQATADGSGAWSVTTAALPDGSHSFTATATTGGTTSASSSPLSVRVDTVAPSAPTIASFSTDTGTVGDGITSDNTLTLTGAAAANSAVKIYDGAMPLGTATANSSGAWSYTTGVLSNAPHSLTATATDAAGNTSAASSALAVTVNTAETGVPTIAAFSNDSGTVGDGITNDNTLILSGTAAANSAVKVFDGTMQIGQTTADGNGAWSYTTVALADGSHGLTVTDPSGTSVTSPVTVDRIAPGRPVVSSFSPDTSPTGDHQTTGTTLTLTGTGEAGSTVKTFDGSVLLGSALVNASGVWSITASGLAVGDHNFTANDTDAAGNTSATSAPLTVTIDSGGVEGGTSNLVVNGGFETGDFTGWTVGKYQPEQILITGNAHSGNFATALGPAGSDGSLSENLATVAGQHYTLHFSLANMSSGANDFSVHWDGTSVFALVDAPSQSYTDYTFEVIATDNNTHLEFDFRQDPTQWRLDDVSVVATGTSQPPPPADTSGNDVLEGTIGGDLLAGGAGDDTYTVNSSGDKVIELANNGIDNVESTITYTLASNVENLQLSGDGAINGAGNGLNNVINGNAASNLLEGNAGNDTLNGRGGEDTLFGGSGNDVFQFSSQFSADGEQVMDFVHDVDKLDFSKIDTSARRSGDQGFTFDGYSDDGRSGHLWAVEDQAAGVTHLYGQTGGFQFHIDLLGTHLGLTSSDFIL
jgi:Bacterial Ig-like domain/RTX calcium-binding nonapeptide repeat (4 copies)